MSKKSWKDKKIRKLDSIVLILISLFFISTINGTQGLFLPILGIVIMLFWISDKKRKVELSDNGISMSKTIWNSKDHTILKWDEINYIWLTQGLRTMWIGYELRVEDKNNKRYHTYVQDRNGFTETLRSIQKSNKNLDNVDIEIVKDIKIKIKK